MTVLLSTAYRAWVVWRYNIPLPLAAFGSHLQQEARDFQRYQVTAEHRHAQRITQLSSDSWLH